MAINELDKSLIIKTANIPYGQIGALNAGAHGYITIAVPESLQGKHILALTASLGHPAGSHLQITIGWLYTEPLGANLYATYYAPQTISASQTDVTFSITYLDN